MTVKRFLMGVGILVIFGGVRVVLGPRWAEDVSFISGMIIGRWCWGPTDAPTP